MMDIMTQLVAKTSLKLSMEAAINGFELILFPSLR